jgi:hypothetical protein
MRNLDLNLIRLQLSRIELVGQQMRTGRVHSQTMNLTHQKSVPSRAAFPPISRLMLHHRSV